LFAHAVVPSIQPLLRHPWPPLSTQVTIIPPFPSGLEYSHLALSNTYIYVLKGQSTVPHNQISKDGLRYLLR
jgi:hypothetical protein